MVLTTAFSVMLKTHYSFYWQRLTEFIYEQTSLLWSSAAQETLSYATLRQDVDMRVELGFLPCDFHRLLPLHIVSAIVVVIDMPFLSGNGPPREGCWSFP
jgi:hypothetical protein